MMRKIMVGPSVLKSGKCRRRVKGRADVRDPITMVTERPSGWERIARGGIAQSVKAGERRLRKGH